MKVQAAPYHRVALEYSEATTPQERARIVSTLDYGIITPSSESFYGTRESYNLILFDLTAEQLFGIENLLATAMEEKYASPDTD